MELLDYLDQRREDCRNEYRNTGNSHVAGMDDAFREVQQFLAGSLSETFLANLDARYQLRQIRQAAR